MKAIVIDQYGDKDKLKEKELSKPEPDSDEVLIEIHAVGINPIDWKLRYGYLKEKFPFDFPIVLGWDAAGIVEKVGKNVDSLQKGDRVFVRPELTNRGTYAEYTTAKEDLVAKMPENISFKEAAAVPLAGLTAYQILVDVGNLDSGDKVLIHAGAGGVGSFAIQIAKNMGAYVATTASTKNVDFLKSLGADEVIDYTKEDFSEVLEDYDLVIDTLGGEIQDKSLTILKNGGMLVSIVEEPDQEKAEKLNVKTKFHWLIPDGKELAALAEMMENQTLKPVVGTVFPFTDQGLKEAHELSETHHARGKIVIEVSS
ncbi:NADP-dependent oxidoreductase [Halanaerobium congolense]|jgi:2-desacetyl-2-hydroxyethyl bacteriochlorophyllide A dehydrogenase|uniref:2-desacetyl-2-hydroxyethyl bacteriochlorophyllide A dehydrogenase n=1 Tax=Halanaerobium congolense TaxID=54121 RepID=A0A1G6NUC3_9FIRM|nr:NADP-dependent oxidoreductase [Halanaerobium congolense]KXS48873.1 MAG: alcohol dehydrogenase [Halanaerobium sp. T82-1]PUU91592.1 MAG: alcohol dehydrogenase [Halanaerobium sp.]PTX17823.1 2-desacetyl-2-hydroxyethyl bacteriochlorophyllide A dehydrogenase [Halanaerobium congolense]PXV63513.1 2-desacetyl-2-hydroxyethyl bacteriochlorophyllide A dehydrogenase [Halanaerobium congolense]TDP19166.1 2-desacetyl-2-hydroxyethyl bacteriochlorophyllide A dehydrogenase [Halanaerobium congolense]